MTQLDTTTATCDAYDYHRPEGHTGKNLLAVCDRLDGHGHDHRESRTGHTWTSIDWTRYAESADGRFVVTARARREPMYQPYEIDPDHYDADPETIATYETERARMMAKFGTPLTRFATGTRFYFGGTGWDAFVGHDAPDDDNDEIGWAHFYAYELEAVAEAITQSSRILRGVELPSSVNDYMRSMYAGCLGCSCSPGMVCKDALKAPSGAIVDVWVDVRSDAEIAEAYAADIPTVHTVERIDAPTAAIEK